jgi:hypothetical protein
VSFPPDVPAGVKLWLSARWINTKLEQGTASHAATLTLQPQELIDEGGLEGQLQTTLGGALQRAA